MENQTVQIYTDHYEVLSSGSVIVPSDESITFIIHNLTFRFVFLEEVPVKDSDIKLHFNVNQIEDYVKIELVNMRIANFATNTSLLELGNINGKELKLKFSICSINTQQGKSDYLMHYTWYLAK